MLWPPQWTLHKVLSRRLRSPAPRQAARQRSGRRRRANRTRPQIRSSRRSNCAVAWAPFYAPPDHPATTQATNSVSAGGAKGGATRRVVVGLRTPPLRLPLNALASWSLRGHTSCGLRRDTRWLPVQQPQHQTLHLGATLARGGTQAATLRPFSPRRRRHLGPPRKKNGKGLL